MTNQIGNRHPASPESADAVSTGWLDIILLLWRSKWLVIVFTIIGVFSGLTYSVLATKWYRADVLLIPASGESKTGLSGSLGALGGLIGIGGIVNGKTLTTEAVAMLRSRDFLSKFVVDQDLLPLIFEKHWDAETGDWMFDDLEEYPSTQDGVRYLQETVLSVSEDPQTGLVRVVIEWKSPKIAAQWANLLVSLINEQMRLRALTEAEANIDYLESQLRDGSVAPLRASISSLLEAELEKVMLARGNSEFAFRIIDSARPPQRQIRPRILVVTFASTSFSVVLGMFLAILFAAFRNSVPS